MVRAGEISLPRVARLSFGQARWRGRAWGMPPKRLPMVLHREVQQRVGERSPAPAPAQRAGQAGDAPGSAAASRFHGSSSASREATDRATVGGLEGVQVGHQGLDLAEELAGQVGDLQAEEVLDLGHEDHHRDAVGEADHHRLRG